MANRRGPIEGSTGRVGCDGRVLQYVVGSDSVVPLLPEAVRLRPTLGAG
jgi:hypothetical protein